MFSLFNFIRIWFGFVISPTAGNDRGKFLIVSNIVGKFVGHSWKQGREEAVQCNEPLQWKCGAKSFNLHLCFQLEISVLDYWIQFAQVLKLKQGECYNQDP